MFSDEFDRWLGAALFILMIGFAGSMVVEAWKGPCSHEEIKK